MSNLIKFYISTLFIIILIFFLILFYPNSINKKINNFFINKAIKTLPSELEYTDIRGNFIKGFTIHNISIIKNNINFSAREIYIDPDLSRMMLNNIVISKLAINNGHIIFKNEIEKNTFFTEKKIFLNKNYEITNLEINNVSVLNDNQLFKINGNTKLIYGHRLYIDFNDLSISSPFFNSSININNGIVTLKDHFVHIDGLKIKSDYLNGSFDLSINASNKLKYLFNIRIDDLNYQSGVNTLKAENILFTKNDNLNLSANQISYNNILINNLNYDAILNNGIFSGKWNFSTSSKRNSGVMSIEAPDSINSIIIDIYNEDNGNLNFKNIFTKMESPDFFKTFTLNISVKNLMYKNMLYDDINSKINIVDYFKVKSGFINIENPHFKTRASINRSSENLLYLHGSLILNDMHTSTYLQKPDASISGKSQYTIKFNNTNDYHIKLISALHKVKMNNFSINDIIDTTYITKNFDQLNLKSQGKISSLHINDLLWHDIPYSGKINDSGSSLFIYCNDTPGTSLGVDIEKMKNSYIVNTFNASVNDLSMSFNPFIINEKNNLFIFNEIEGRLNDGTVKISGIYKNSDDYAIKVTASNISIEKAKKILNQNIQLTGLIDYGHIEIEKNKIFDTFFYSKLNIMNGKINNIKFDSLNINSNYRDNRLLLSDLTISKDKGQFKGNGWFNLNKINTFNISEMDFFMKFNDFNIENFNNYFPFPIKSKGLLSGTFKAAGLIEDFVLSGDFKINAPIFDKLIGTTLKGEMLYKKNRLYFNKVNLKTTGGTYTGVGNFPLNFENTINNFNDKSIDFTLTGKSDNLNLFSPYISNIDSINSTVSADSTFTMLLDIRGDYNNPIRNGKLICNDATIYLDQFKNPITNIKSNFTITDNILNIDEFKGKSIKEIDYNILNTVIKKINRVLKNTKKEINNDIFIKGKIDLNSFFKPYFDITLDSEEIYIESSYDNFFGYGALSLSVEGRDTILVNGSFLPTPNNFVITNYSTSYEYIDDKIKSNYRMNLNIPFDNGIEINTDNANIFADGDLTISNNEINQYIFSGRVNFIDGRYFDDQGNHYENISGQLILSPDDQSSYIDIHAITNIMASTIDVSVIGNPSNPQIYFSDQENQYNQTQLLTLLTFGSPEIHLENNLTNVENLLSNYLENKIERNIADMATLDEFQLNSSESLLNTMNSNDDIDLKLILGKRISKKIYLNSHIDFYDFDDNEYEAEYRLSPNSSLVGGINTNDGNNSFHIKYRIKHYY